jgi:cytochrome c oxidase subunit II
MMTILVIVAVLMVVASGVQILKVSELVATSKGAKIYEISEKESKLQGFLMLIFVILYFVAFAWQVWEWWGLRLPESASEHGLGYDNLMNVTLWFITPVFFVTHVALGWFCYKYAFSSSRKADYFTHSNKLEMIWTIIPSIALAVLILYGLSQWNTIMTPISDEEDHVLVELYAKQFDWTARYAGEDGKLGRANFKLIEGTNALGIDETDENAADDKIVKGEFHLPIGKPVQFVFRAQDVMHSAYMPHFRAQMNCVPGLKTAFNFVPRKTTKEMQEITGNEDFQYILLCNKICGAAHYNMQMDIIVESQEDYDKWIAEQKEFAQ